MSVLLEVCVDSFESAVAAREGGADRLEVCGPLVTGGTTPSFGFVERCVQALGLPVMMMVRPHDGEFQYGDDDLAIMERDIEVATQIGVTGVVFGVLRGDSVDEEACRRLLDVAGDLETTFHRAFDVVSDPLAAFGRIQEVGFSRVLTSGQGITADQGAGLIRKLVNRSTKTRVLAGCGIDSENVASLIEATGVDEVHASASRRIGERSNTTVVFGDQRRVTDAAVVRSIRAELVRLMPR
ncbi:MAG: copper homeostasis protein CutC [Planctomycetota bacterium]